MQVGDVQCSTEELIDKHQYQKLQHQVQAYAITESKLTPPKTQQNSVVLRTCQRPLVLKSLTLELLHLDLDSLQLCLAVSH